jgi:hypothetical protein
VARTGASSADHLDLPVDGHEAAAERAVTLGASRLTFPG